MRTVPVLLLAAAATFCAALPSAFAAPPQPGLEAAKPTPVTIPTGFDLAVVDIQTLGPGVPCVYCPVIVVKNRGSRAVSGTFQVKYTCNGTVVYPFRDVVLNLAPGATQKIAPHMPLDQNFARYGDTVEAKIDVDNRLKEDNEQNNTFAKKLRRLTLQPAQGSR